jgi:hypothetical protein
MNENDEDVMHAGIVSKSPKNPGIQAVFGIRHRQAKNILVIDTHVGNVSEQFSQMVVSQMLRDHSQELELGMDLAGYEFLFVRFQGVYCRWQTHTGNPYTGWLRDLVAVNELNRHAGPT